MSPFRTANFHIFPAQNCILQMFLFIFVFLHICPVQFSSFFIFSFSYLSSVRCVLFSKSSFFRFLLSRIVLFRCFAFQNCCFSDCSLSELSFFRFSLLRIDSFQMFPFQSCPFPDVPLLELSASSCLLFGVILFSDSSFSNLSCFTFEPSQNDNSSEQSISESFLFFICLLCR